MNYRRQQQAQRGASSHSSRSGWEAEAHQSTSGERADGNRGGRTGLYEPLGKPSSVISVPHRCREWGDGRFRGNCDGTLFKELLLRYKPTRVADPMMGSGTTADVVRGFNRARGVSIKYWGGDLSRGFNLLEEALPATFDFVWIHPPYWDIIKFSDGNQNDLSREQSWEDFMQQVHVCLTRCTDALSVGGHLAVLVGDVRRNGSYYSMQSEILRRENEYGELQSILIKEQHACRSDGKSYARFPHAPIRHEYCLVFRKNSGTVRARRWLSTKEMLAQVEADYLASRSAA